MKSRIEVVVQVDVAKCIFALAALVLALAKAIAHLL